MRRRDFLRLAAITAGAAACGTTDEPTAGDLDAAASPDASPSPDPRDLGAIPASTQFALGVMAGDALADRALLWTKYTGQHALLVYVQDAAGAPVRELSAVIAPGGFVHVDADGLAPGTRYEYAFLERTAAGDIVGRSAIGKFRAALAPDALEPVTFAGVSCTSQYRDVTSANLARLAARTDLSFALHAGDQLYADSPAEDQARDLAGYHAKYAHAWSRPGLGALHAAAGMYVTWDDHEIYNDWTQRRDEPRIAAGTQAYFEHTPIREAKLWRSVRWGKTLELFVLDGRSERDPAAGKYLSDAQLQWLVDGLRASPAVFKFVLSSCPIGVFPADTIDRWRSPIDRWANPAYAAQRTAVLDVCQEVGGVWWLSGDFHFGTVGRVQYPNTDRYGRVREVLMGAGGQGLGSSDAIPAAMRATQIQNLDNTNTHWTFATPANNYVVIRANPVADATHPAPWLDLAFYDATTQLFSGEYRLL